MYAITRSGFRWGAVLVFPSVLGALPLTRGDGDVEVFLSPAPEAACSWDFFPTLIFGLTFLSITSITSQELRRAHPSVNVCSKNWPCESQEGAEEHHRARKGIWIWWSYSVLFKRDSRSTALGKVTLFFWGGSGFQMIFKVLFNLNHSGILWFFV